MAWESFFSPLLLFWKCEVPPQIWKLGVYHVVVKLPVLPKACVIPCWEKPGERENVISDCLWATVWENEQCFSCQWARLAGSELGRSRGAGRAWGATGADGLSTHASSHMQCCVWCLLLCPAQIQVLWTSRQRAGLHSEHSLTVLWGCAAGRKLKSKRNGV